MTKLEVTNPFDKSLIEKIPLENEAEAFDALAIAHEAFLHRDKWPTLLQRLDILKRALAIMISRKSELINTAVLEGGKPYQDSLVEIERGLCGMQIAIDTLFAQKGSMVAMDKNAASKDKLAFTMHEPRGVVFAISAFNHPFNLIIHQVIPSIAVGAPILVKPASSTPLSCLAIVDILHEAGLESSWCHFLPCTSSTAEKIVKDSRISFLTFVGSAKVGWHLRSQLASGAHCSLEHGGLAPVIIDSSAKIDDHIDALVKASFYHAGQVCVSAQRIFVHESIIDNFCQQFVSATNKLKTGNPLNHDTDVGPLISPTEVSRIDEWVDDAARNGGTIVCGGKKISDSCYAPSVVMNPGVSAKIMREEIFGPVVAINSFNDINDAIACANQPDVFFQAAVFASDINTAINAARKLNGTAIMINEHPAFRVDWMPFGGHRQSGLGMGGIANAMADMQIEKMVVIKAPR